MTRMGIFAVSHTHQVYMHDGTDGKGPRAAPRRRMRRPEESERDLRRSRTDLARFLGKDWCTKPRGFPPNLQLRRTAIRFWSGFPIGTLAQDWDSFAFKSGTWRPKVGHFPAYFARLTCFLTI